MDIDEVYKTKVTFHRVMCWTISWLEAVTLREDKTLESHCMN